MNKTSKRALVISTLLTIVLALISVLSFADVTIPKPTPPKDQGFNNQVGTIIGFIQAIGVAVALGMLIVIGIRYVSADSSKKAEIKEQAITYVFGAFCIFAAVSILGIIQTLSKSVTKNNA